MTERTTSHTFVLTIDAKTCHAAKRDPVLMEMLMRVRTFMPEPEVLETRDEGLYARQTFTR